MTFWTLSFNSKPTRSHGITKAVEEAVCLVFGSCSPSLPFLRTIINTSRCTALKACKIHTSTFYNRSVLPFLDLVRFPTLFHAMVVFIMMRVAANSSNHTENTISRISTSN
ncbi:hypothetical protein BDV39DRAFT_105712 [Aspergillus sergii]|uniref:Uncharacterized protein n=1 Tax=Aspergillus sergii TaxID=1034303 RepID=A0A5N6WWM2_9EURO|nr:hypothetical protein BDV39DRAFT_105712 [Aspergillus sergii]